MVDDDPQDFQLLQEAWRDVGEACEQHFPVATALLEQLDELPVPRLAIVDVNLPAVSGRELGARLRTDTRFRAVPVVMCSSASSPNERRLAEKAGAIGF